MALTKVPSNLDATIATTQSQGNNSTNIATTAYVDLAISNLSDSAPAALNTLNEIAAALGDDANYASTTTAAIAGKLPLSGGAMTGAITTNSTFDGVDIAARDAVLTSTTTTANAALPKAGGTLTGVLTGTEFNVGVNYAAKFNAKQSNADAYGIVLDETITCATNDGGHRGIYVTNDVNITNSFTLSWSHIFCTFSINLSINLSGTPKLEFIAKFNFLFGSGWSMM